MSKLAGPEYFSEFGKYLEDETDRGVAIVAAAYFDELLGALLPPPPTTKKKKKRFVSFGERIEQAFDVGLISKIEQHDLDVLRDLRNDFAHRMRVNRFDTERKAKVESLSIWKKASKLGARRTALSTARERLIYVAGCLAVRFKKRNGGSVPANDDPPLWNPDAYLMTVGR